MDHKPNVFPTPEQRAEALKQTEASKVAAYEREKAIVTNQIYQGAMAPPTTQSDAPTNYDVNGHVDATEMMRQRAQKEMEIRKSGGVVKYPELAEEAVSSTRRFVDQNASKNDELMRLRDEQIKKNNEMIKNYQVQANKAVERNNPTGMPGLYPQEPVYPPVHENRQPYQPKVQEPAYQPPVNYGKVPDAINPYIIEISQPNYNSPFDVIPLPSEGRLNRGVKPSVRMGYMTTADENILTSPNLLESGQFLEILINRKLLEPSLRYKDLHVGDRNALMIWLRATGYGEMYPVTLLDENDIPFDTEINLNELKTKKLGAEPNSEGLLPYQFPLCKATILFRFLTCGDIDNIERLVSADKERGYPIDRTNVYTMEHMIHEVNGDRSRETINAFANSIRIGDAKEFTKYVDSIESGIDLNLEVRTPGGGSISTFLPLNINFFWPNIKL